MTIRKKIEKAQGQENMTLESVISRGANVKEDSVIAKEWSFLNLRIPSTLLAELDEVLSKKVGISRTGWILQAIQYSIAREKSMN